MHQIPSCDMEERKKRNFFTAFNQHPLSQLNSRWSYCWQLSPICLCSVRPFKILKQKKKNYSIHFFSRVCMLAYRKVYPWNCFAFIVYVCVWIWIYKHTTRYVVFVDVSKFFIHFFISYWVCNITWQYAVHMCAVLKHHLQVMNKKDAFTCMPPELLHKHFTLYI